MDDLSPYDRTRVALWRASAAALAGDRDDPCLRGAAVQALLVRLRAVADRAVLLGAYERDTAADFALIGSLLPGDVETELFWRVRDAAFDARWRELDGADP
jgi:hypothetical protein